MAASTITRSALTNGTTPWNASTVNSAVYDKIDELFGGVGTYATLELGGALKINGALTQLSNDGGALGTSSLGWSDLFLASGGVINFNNADVTITHSANTLTFAGADSGYIFANGPLKTPTTVSVGNATPATTGAGITFPASQSASSDANTLDDYEEGTWTPVDSSGAGLTFVQGAGTYTKVGRLVFCFAVIEFPATANATAALIGGLPFATASANAARGGGNLGWTNEATAAYILPGSGSTEFRVTDESGTNLTNATLSGNSLIFSVAYYV